MAKKNLTVKSKFFAMKDTLEVDDAQVKDIAGTPTEADITALANSAIQADKDILSKITYEYDENDNETTITFPKGVFPLSFANFSYDETLYFDTGSDLVLNNLNEPKGSIVGYDNFVIIIEGEVYSSENDSLLYLLGNNVSFSINTYYLFNPITELKTINNESLIGSGNINISGGSKLYNHIITGTFSSIAIIFNVYSKKAEAYTSSTLVSAFKDCEVVFGGGRCYGIDKPLFGVSVRSALVSALSFLYHDGTNFVCLEPSGMPTISDIVQEL